MVKMDGWMNGMTNFQSCFSHWSYTLYCRFSECISHIWRNWGASLEGHRMVPLIPFPLPCPSYLTSSELSPHCRRDNREGCCSFALPSGSYRYRTALELQQHNYMWHLDSEDPDQKRYETLFLDAIPLQLTAGVHWDLNNLLTYVFYWLHLDFSGPQLSPPPCVNSIKSQFSFSTVINTTS